MKDNTPDRPGDRPRLIPLRGGERAVLRVLLDEVVRAAANRVGIGDVTVGIDVPATVTIEADGRVLARVLTPLVARALEGARREAGPCRPEVLLTGVVCHDGIEIEVASSGASVDPCAAALLGRRGATRPEGREGTGSWACELIREAALLGGTLSAADCPEGGAAVTLRLPFRQASRRRAA